MKLLILGLLAVALLAAGSSRDCFGQWRSEARERAMEAREQAREAREQVRELQKTQRQQMRALRDELRAERDRIRREVREGLRDWRYTY
jgi:vacuolar-type H+-ATPase subunit H